jgi:hypothetical protein
VSEIKVKVKKERDYKIKLIVRICEKIEGIWVI